MKFRRMAMLAWRLARKTLGFEKTVYVESRAEEYRSYWAAAAELVGASLETVDGSIWRVTRGRESTMISLHVTEIDSPVVLELAGSKEYLIGLARANDVPVAHVLTFTLGDVQSAATAIRDGEVYVVKPAAGSSSGVGITTHVRDVAGLKKAATLASLFSEQILLERMIVGESCRLLFIDGEFVHAVRRRGERVTGDGARSLDELLSDQSGENTRDATTSRTLRAQGLKIDYVPAAGEEVLTRFLPGSIRRFREVRTIYDETITELVGEALIDEVARVVKALGARFVGVDVVTCDPTVSLEDSGGAFLEVNTTPGIHHHYNCPEDYESHGVATRLLEKLLTESPATNSRNLFEKEAMS